MECHLHGAGNVTGIERGTISRFLNSSNQQKSHGALREMYINMMDLNITLTLPLPASRSTYCSSRTNHTTAMFAAQLFTTVLAFLAVGVQASPLSPRDVIVPKITNPTAGSVWPVGTVQTVTWYVYYEISPGGSRSLTMH